MSESLDLALRVEDRLDVHLTARSGDVVGVVGPNGSGKTTLVQALAGLVPADGHAHLDGRDLVRLPVRERDVGLVFQDQRLFPHLSALDNVAFGPRARGVPRREADATARDWLDRFGLGDLTDRRPGQMSGGQAQRVAIARALATKPRLLLLDEPFAGLDIGIATTLRLDLARHLRDFDGITLLVTHDPLEAQVLSTRLLVLDHGKVAQQGTPAEVAAHPRTDHVARLVGLNLIRDGGRLGVFRPRDAVLSQEAPTGSARHRWRGAIASVTPHGEAVRVLVEGPVGVLADITPSAVAELELAPGREIWVSVKETVMEWYAER